MIDPGPVQKGSRDLESLIRSYNTRLFRVVLPLVRDQAEAEDVLQDTWMKVHRALPGFRGGSEIFTWIYRIAVNTAFSQGRRKRPDRLEDDHPDSRGSYEPEKEFEKKRLRKALAEAVKVLTGKQREVFLLRTFEDLAYDEISRLLGMSVNSAKTTYFYAVRKVRALLKRHFEV